MDKNVNDSDRSPASNSVAPTVGPSMTPPKPKRKSEKREDAAKAGSTRDSDPTM